MKTGKVIGNVWSTRRLAEIPSAHSWRSSSTAPIERLVAFDVLGSGIGERVLVSRGSAPSAGSETAAPPWTH